jgi:putative peptidoglycan binding protein/resolvase-like protein
VQARTYAHAARAARAGIPALAAALALLCLPALARASAPYGATSAHPAPIPSTSWHGRAIRRPQPPIDPSVLSRASYPAGWSAGAVGYGSGYRRPGGSRRVREVQRRLTRLGYRPGPIDGLYGPLTRSSVEWFQIKHGIRPTGVVNAGTLAVLRRPHSAWRRPGAVKPPAPPPRPTGKRASRPLPVRHHTPAWLLPLLVVLLILAVAAAAAGLAAARNLLRGGTRRIPLPLLRPSPPPPPMPPEEEPEPSSEVVALGYVSVAGFEPIEHHVTAIAEACERHAWVLARVVQDHRPAWSEATARPGLTHALEQLSRDIASCLVASTLDHLGSSPADLRPVLAWFLRTGRRLAVVDMGLDSGTPEGKATLRSLLAMAESAQSSAEAPPAAGERTRIEEHPQRE